MVVLVLYFFRCNWFQNDVDEYGLTQVYFNRLCSTIDPYVLASQVHQVYFYVGNPVEKEVYYARNKIPTDLYDLEDEHCSNIKDTFWREPNDGVGSSSRLCDVNINISREDMSVEVVDMPAYVQDPDDITTKTS